MTVSTERLAELISDAMDCTKWDAETWRVVNTVTDHDDHMSTEQALALGNLISRQSHSTGVRAWEGYWPGAGSIDSQTRLTRFKKTADEWRAEGAEVTPLYTHPKEAEVTVTEEIGEFATSDEAVKAAQADYERRILSALEPASLHKAEDWREFRPDEEDLPPTGMVEVRWRDSAPGKEAHKGDAAAIGWQYVAWWRPVASSAPLPVGVTDEEFSITLKPTRTGFKHPHDDGKLLRLWVGQTNRGQSMSMLSYGFYCTGSFDGMDYTPVDASEFADVPRDVTERISAVNALTAAEVKSRNGKPGDTP